MRRRPTGYVLAAVTGKAFLLTFATVNVLAATQPDSLAVMAVLVILIVLVRPVILHQVNRSRNEE